VGMDFGVLNLYPNIAQKDKLPDTVTDYVLVLQYKDKEGKLHRDYIDLLCDDISTKNNDFFYVRHGWDFLLSHTQHFTPFHHIHTWSDGGSKHFKQVYAFQYFSQLFSLYHKHISNNFFASYHGHGLWDAHFAHNNTIIRDYLKKKEKDRRQAYSRTEHIYKHHTESTPLSNVYDVQKLLLSEYNKILSQPKPKNRPAYVSYHIYVLAIINRDPSLKACVKTLAQGTHIYHNFEYDDNDSTIVYTRKVTSAPDCAVQHFVSAPLPSPPTALSLPTIEQSNVKKKKKSVNKKKKKK
jgi:hypothetical protein